MRTMGPSVSRIDVGRLLSRSGHGYLSQPGRGQWIGLFTICIMHPFYLPAKRPLPDHVVVELVPASDRGQFGPRDVSEGVKVEAVHSQQYRVCDNS